MTVEHATPANFDTLKNTPGKLVVIDFGATWCPPCRAIKPIFAELSEEHKDVLFVAVDVDECSSVPDLKDIRGVPTFRFYRDGKKVSEFSGNNAAQLRKTIADLK